MKKNTIQKVKNMHKFRREQFEENENIEDSNGKKLCKLEKKICVIDT